MVDCSTVAIVDDWVARKLSLYVKICRAILYSVCGRERAPVRVSWSVGGPICFASLIRPVWSYSNILNFLESQSIRLTRMAIGLLNSTGFFGRRVFAPGAPAADAWLSLRCTIDIFYCGC